jgi:hypothetical protein
MSVPAHVHWDAHNPDTYEAMLGHWGFPEVNGFGFMRHGEHGTYSPQGYYSATSLQDLFSHMAMIAACFESDGWLSEVWGEGNCSRYAGHQTPHTSCWDDYDECVIHQDVLQPEAIRHVAGLYELFWNTVRGGECGSCEQCAESRTCYSYEGFQQATFCGGACAENEDCPRRFVCSETGVCEPEVYRECDGQDVILKNTCGHRLGVIMTCYDDLVCDNGECVENVQCSGVGGTRCEGNQVYAEDNCGNDLGVVESCGDNKICRNGECVVDVACGTQLVSRCVGNQVFVRDSCGNEMGLVEDCGLNQRCEEGACVSAGDCGSVSELECDGNLVIETDGCGIEINVVDSCEAGNVCRNGVCVDDGSVIDDPAFYDEPVGCSCGVGATAGGRKGLFVFVFVLFCFFRVEAVGRSLATFRMGKRTNADALCREGGSDTDNMSLTVPRRERCLRPVRWSGRR